MDFGQVDNRLFTSISIRRQVILIHLSLHSFPPLYLDLPTGFGAIWDIAGQDAISCLIGVAANGD